MNNPITTVNYHQLARSIPKNDRIEFLQRMPETTLHKHLKELFTILEPNYLVEITHGVDEYGRDLVMLREDSFGSESTAVVVKRGKISGKTLGEVDDIGEVINKLVRHDQTDERAFKEVRSQVKQSVSTPTEMKAKYESVPTTQVLVIIAGTVGTHAKKRLRSEVQFANVRILDINWLVENFTTAYPEVFFQGEIVRFVQELMESYERYDSTGTSRQQLSEYFVEPTLNEVLTPIGVGEMTDLDVLGKWKQKLTILELVAAINEKQALLVSGAAGTGKSSLARIIARDGLADSYSRLTRHSLSELSQIRLPIIVSAIDLATIPDVDALRNKIMGGRDELRACTISCLIVDGLDEVDTSARQGIADKAIAISTALNCGLLVTSRTDQSDLEKPLFRQIEIAPFSFEQAIEMIRRVIKTSSKVDALREGLMKVRHQIPIIPLSLMLLIDLVEKNHEVPASISELYDRYVDLMLGKHDTDKGMSVLYDPYIKKNFLASLAYYEMFMKNRIEIPDSELTAFIRQFANRYRYEMPQVEQFMIELGRTGFITLGTTVSFKHKSFVEFFAAFYIYDNQDSFEDINRKLRDIYYSGLWSDVCLFFVGLRHRLSSGLLSEIIDYEATSYSDVLSKYRAGRLLQAGWHSETDVKLLGIDSTLSLYPAVRDDTDALLKAAGRTVPRFFVEVLISVIGRSSLSSMFLKKELEDTLQELLDSPDQDKQHIDAAILVSRALLPLCDSAEVDEKVTLLEATIARSTQVTDVERASALLVLKQLGDGNPTLAKAIMARLKKLVRNNPSIPKILIPPNSESLTSNTALASKHRRKRK